MFGTYDEWYDRNMVRTVYGYDRNMVRTVYGYDRNMVLTVYGYDRNMVRTVYTIETWWNIIHTVHWFDKNMVHTVFEHDRNMQGTKYEADIQPKLTIAFILSRCLYIVLYLCWYLGCNICMSAFFWWSIFIHPVLAFNSHSPYISFNRCLDREAWNTCIIPNGQ